MEKAPVKILLIDDNEHDNYYHKLVLEKSERISTIDVVTDGHLGLEYLEEIGSDLDQLPAIIFLDINMPVMNGFEFLKEFREKDPAIQDRISISMLTTSVNEQDKVKAERIYKIAGFFSKPLNLEILDQVVLKHFENLKV